MAIMENAFQNLFTAVKSNTGDEELLRIASNFARQLTSNQIRAIQMLRVLGRRCENEELGQELITFAEEVFELLQYNHSDVFVMRALDAISLRKFMNENSMKINIDK